MVRTEFHFLTKDNNQSSESGNEDSSQSSTIVFNTEISKLEELTSGFNELTIDDLENISVILATSDCSGKKLYQGTGNLLPYALYEDAPVEIINQIIENEEINPLPFTEETTSSISGIQDYFLNNEVSVYAGVNCIKKMGIKANYDYSKLLAYDYETFTYEDKVYKIKFMIFLEIKNALFSSINELENCLYEDMNNLSLTEYNSLNLTELFHNTSLNIIKGDTSYFTNLGVIPEDNLISIHDFGYDKNTAFLSSPYERNYSHNFTYNNVDVESTYEKTETFTNNDNTLLISKNVVKYSKDNKSIDKILYTFFIK